MRRFALGLAAAMVCLLLSACNEQAAELANGFRAKVDELLGVQAATGPDSGAKKKRKRSAHLVEAALVQEDEIAISATYTGSLAYRQRVKIYNQEEGRLTRLPHFEGDSVKAGELLLALDDALLQSELRSARARTAEAQANARRIERLRSRNMAAEEEYLRATTALEVSRAEQALLETRLGYTEIEAPFDALIAERKVEVEDVLPRHTHALTLVDPSSLVSELEVSEILLATIELGDSVQVRIDALGDHVFTGYVRRIFPEIDPQTRHGRVEVELRPFPEGARAGQFARVRFDSKLQARKQVPFSALRRDRRGEYVFRLGESGKAERADVRAGRRVLDRVEILEGLEVGERVVSRGFLGLIAGKEVEVIKADQLAD